MKDVIKIMFSAWPKNYDCFEKKHIFSKAS